MANKNFTFKLATLCLLALSLSSAAQAATSRIYEFPLATVWDGYFPQDKPGGVTQKVPSSVVEAKLVSDGFIKTSVLVDGYQPLITSGISSQVWLGPKAWGQVADAQVASGAAIAWSKISKSGAVAADVGAQADRSGYIAVTGDGEITVASGSRLEGIYQVRWEGTNRVEQLMVTVSTNSYGDATLNVLDYHCYGAVSSLSAVTVRASTDNTVRYLTVTIGNRNGSLGGLETTYLGVDNPGWGGDYGTAMVLQTIALVSRQTHFGSALAADGAITFSGIAGGTGGIVRATSTGALGMAVAADFPTLNQSTTGNAATLTAARTLTIGGTGKSFNGSADVAWSLAEIGAAPVDDLIITDDVYVNTTVVPLFAGAMGSNTPFWFVNGFPLDLRFIAQGDAIIETATGAVLATIGTTYDVLGTDRFIFTGLSRAVTAYESIAVRVRTKSRNLPQLERMAVGEMLYVVDVPNQTGSIEVTIPGDASSANKYEIRPPIYLANKEALVVHAYRDYNGAWEPYLIGAPYGTVAVGSWKFESSLMLAGSNRSALRLGTQSTPATLADGDIWFDGTNIKIRIGGVTKTFTVF